MSYGQMDNHRPSKYSKTPVSKMFITALSSQIRFLSGNQPVGLYLKMVIHNQYKINCNRVVAKLYLKY